MERILPVVTSLFIRRGDICLVDFKKNEGSEQDGLRPALVLQNNTGNRFSSTVVVCPITSAKKQFGATHVTLFPNECGIQKTSIVLCEQIRAIDKSRIRKKVGNLCSPEKLIEVEKRMAFLLGLNA